MGVVMSLFQRSDDNQKFLVTLNGYNNNLMKEKNTSDDDERLEMEVVINEIIHLLCSLQRTFYELISININFNDIMFTGE